MNKYQETTSSNSHTACTDVKKPLHDTDSSFSSPVALSISDRWIQNRWDGGRTSSDGPDMPQAAHGIAQISVK